MKNTGNWRKRSIRKLYKKNSSDFELDYEFVFTDSQTLDITDEDQINNFLITKNRILY